MAQQYIGKAMGRMEGMDKATGRAMYAGDFYEDGMLELALARAEISHGKIVSLDCSRVPSDVQVFTAKDLAENIVEDVIEDMPVLAEDRVRYLGEPIAILAADTADRGSI